MARPAALLFPFFWLLPAAEPATAQEPRFEYVRDAGGWLRVESHGTYRVNPSVVSVRFVAGIDSLAACRAVAGELPGRAGGLIARLEAVRSNRLGIHDLRVGAGDDVLEVVALLRATGLVEFAEENTLGRFDGAPDDPGYAQQWQLENTGQTGGTPDADVDGDLAWVTTAGDPAIVIAVLDSGVEIGHADLAPNVWTNAGEIPNNHIDDDGNHFVDDYYGWDFIQGDGDVGGTYWHGTAVAGLFGARANNGVGVAGLAGGYGASAGCRTLAVVVGGFQPDAAIVDDAILYAVDQGARVVTMSLAIGQSSAVEAALEHAWNQAGVFVDCSSGNSGGNVTYPARSPFVVSVAATDATDARPSFSCSGPENWISAPGVDVYTTTTGNGYTPVTGTSFASPLVGAAAGLVLSVLPNTSNESVKEILRLTADDVQAPGYDVHSGWGRLDAAAAVELAAAEDCNGNGVWDAEDLAAGTSTDGDGDGVPDECACGTPVTYCSTAPNSNGAGARISADGSASVSADDLVLRARGAAVHQLGLFYYGRTQVEAPFGNGFRCVGGTTFRLPVVRTNPAGDASFPIDLSAPPDPAGRIRPGAVWNFQFWFRDPAGGGASFNLSDGLEVLFCP